MGEEFDPVALGLKCGLEIHQQLGRPGDAKLFCSCPAHIVEREPDLIIERQLRASAGEMGDVDMAAREAQAKQKVHVYHSFHDTCCLVELDEEPPHPVNPEAVTTAVMIAKAMGSTILPRIQFMRKTIVDGSNVSGFQRTALFALGGQVPGLTLPVRIQAMCLEEESAKIVERKHDRDIYNLSRLGVPLIEIATAPDIRTPQQAQEVAKQIGMVLRSTRRVKRGLGTIRQDLNVSVTGGARCEIKGAQDLRLLPQIIEYEARRQASLVDLKNRLANVVIALGEPQDLTELFSHGKGFIAKAIASGDAAIGVRVANCKGVFGTQLCPNYRVGSELSDIAKTWGFGGIIHSDEDMTKYGVEGVAHALSCGPKDAFLVLIGDPERIRKVLELRIAPRIFSLQEGVPQEVRRANADATSSYLRPVPGASRMYPETDIPLVDVHMQGIAAPKLLSEQIDDLVRETKLSKDTVLRLMAADIDVLAYHEEFPALSYKDLASVLIDWPAEIASRAGTVLAHAEEYVTIALPLVVEKKIALESIKSLLEEIASRLKAGKPVERADVLALAASYEQLSDEELGKLVAEAIAEQPDGSVGALMGKIMTRVRGRADGKRVQALLAQRR